MRAFQLRLLQLFLIAFTLQSSVTTGAAELDRVDAHVLSHVQSEYSHHVWTTEDGLPDNWIECILQTRDGYLWIGTRYGLVRFDGVKFATFNQNNAPEFKKESCRALAVDTEGALWIATKAGVVRYRARQFAHFSTIDGLGHEETSSLCASHNGGVWIGTGDGVSLCREGRITNYPNDRLAHGFAYSVYEDRNGRVWAGFLDGLHQLDLKTGRFSPVWTSTTRSVKHGQNIVGCIREDTLGNLWFGTSHGLYRLAGGKVSVYEQNDGISGGIVSSIFSAPSGTMWVVASLELHESADPRGSSAWPKSIFHAPKSIACTKTRKRTCGWDRASEACIACGVRD